MMGKGKKKKANKGKKNGKKVMDDTGVGLYASYLHATTPEQKERARLAAANRTEDPLKNWTRPMQEECPICMLPFPLGASGSKYCITCGKIVCAGCMISSGLAHIRDGGDAETAFEKAKTCAFCRSNTDVDDKKTTLEKEMKRANTGNGESMFRIARYYFGGEMGLRQDKAEGLKWYHRAVEAGSGKAAYLIGNLYLTGDGVDQDEDIALDYIQKAADLGNVFAFHVVGMILVNKGDIEDGMLNYRKAVICGMSDDGLFNTLRSGFREEYVTKEEYAFTLREHQKACNEVKSDGSEAYKSIRSEK